MPELDYFLSIGVMTGNSLDAADFVLTKFGSDGSISDLEALSIPMPVELADRFRIFRSAVTSCGGDMNSAIASYGKRVSGGAPSSHTVDQLISDYTLYIADGVKELVKRATSKALLNSTVDVIGLNGQTCAHQPPSIAKNKQDVYTVQLGDGQLLANETGIPVVFDFRSDDLMNGGEAAPLAPVHHEHLAHDLKARGKFPVAFCNAGNTGNISIISTNLDGRTVVLGWDTGPFNDYPDKLMQAEHGVPCDMGGEAGTRGRINLDLLRLLFEKGAVTEYGDNYLLRPPPKSSDPQWYRLLPELCGEACVDSIPLPFEDRLRTAEYLSAYIYYYSLKWVPPEIQIPTHFALCGGGWNNPVPRIHFEQLLQGDYDNSPVLPEHEELFGQINQRLKATAAGSIEIAFSDEFGFSGQYMEARLFADAAICRIRGVPFARPEITGCRTPTVLGIIRFPHGKKELASAKFNLCLDKHQSTNLAVDNPELFDGRWSRACRGWNTRVELAAERH